MSDSKWDELTLAVHNAILSCGTFQEPPPGLTGLTLGEWELVRAKRVVAAVRAHEPKPDSAPPPNDSQKP